ncbi:MAG: hypothetical protein IJN80_00700 [Clostridia bacterium]|nr:hypothetical protein [Clostridia bacterium]
MMMKIIGAALIVSGGYLLGRIRIHQWNIRLKNLKRVCELFECYLGELSEYRTSVEEFFSNQGNFGKELLGDDSIMGLTAEDLQRARGCMERLKRENYQESLRIVRKYIDQLKALIKALEEEAGSSGKALPLVTGVIGFLIAVFLF